jgi:hypothetical protein
MESFQQPVHHTFRGKCLAIVQPANAKGNIVVKAGAAGLKSGAITIEVQ